MVDSQNNPYDVLAVIPARKGSKGLPGKNMKEFNGKPLLYWTLLAATQSNQITTTILSTDSDEAASLAEQLGIRVPWIRSAELATDEATTADVVIDALRKESLKKKEYRFVLVLEPTSPLRKRGEIDEIVIKLTKTQTTTDAIVTAGRVGFHPSAIMKKDGALAKPYIEDMRFENRRQDGEPAYLPTGNCFAIKTDVFLTGRSFYPEKVEIHELEPFQVFEIDDLTDFELVEFLYQRHKDWLISPPAF